MKYITLPDILLYWSIVLGLYYFTGLIGLHHFDGQYYFTSLITLLVYVTLLDCYVAWIVFCRASAMKRNTKDVVCVRSEFYDWL